MKYLMIMNAFKGTLSSVVLNDMIGTTMSLEEDELIKISISDGGEGFLDAIEANGHYQKLKTNTVNSVHEPIQTTYLYDHKNQRIYIESAKVIGLSLLSKSQHNPYKTSSYGLGLVVKHVLKHKPKQIIIGLGGSSTNDGGAGMLSALGVRFLDRYNQLIQAPTGLSLADIQSIDISQVSNQLKTIDFIIASDVENPLLGINGASKVYAKQKGASPSMIQRLEKNMVHYSQLTQIYLNKNLSQTPGSGAAGGLAYALITYLNGHMVSGFDLISQHMDLESIIKDVDVVVTGEGKFDQQSFFGKAPIKIAKIAHKMNKKVIGIFGSIEPGIKTGDFNHTYCLVPDLASYDEAISKPDLYIKKIGQTIKKET
jgi:glycerate kinase